MRVYMHIIHAYYAHVKFFYSHSVAGELSRLKSWGSSELHTTIKDRTKIQTGKKQL